MVSDECHRELTRLHVPHAPIVQVVVQEPITDLILQVLDNLAILHVVERVEHVELHLVCLDQHIGHTLLHAVRRRHIVVGVADAQVIILCMLQHLARQVVEREEVGELATHGTIHVGVDDLVLRQQEVANFLLTELDRERVL